MQEILNGDRSVSKSLDLCQYYRWDGKLLTTEGMNMTLDLKTLFKWRYEFESSTLGRLHCRGLSLGVFGALGKILADKNITGRQFIVKLLEQVAERMPDGEEGRPDPERKGIRITAEEADQLSDEEIEGFARGFLVENSDLLQTYEGARGSSQRTKKARRSSR
jgi:hypothetical protein